MTARAVPPLPTARSGASRSAQGSTERYPQADGRIDENCTTTFKDSTAARICHILLEHPVVNRAKRCIRPDVDVRGFDIHRANFARLLMGQAVFLGEKDHLESVDATLGIDVRELEAL